MTDYILTLSLTNLQYQNMLQLLQKQTTEITADLVRFEEFKKGFEPSSFRTKNPAFLEKLNSDIKSLQLLLTDNLTTQESLEMSCTAFHYENKISS
jgi:hypothetical protein